MITEKQLARQDADFAINPGNNNETSIKITTDICCLFFEELPSATTRKRVTFFIYKEDFFKSACGIISSLPLLDKHGKPIAFKMEFCNQLLSRINDYFGTEAKKEYSAELLFNTDRNSCLQRFDSTFNIRSYTVEEWTTISFVPKTDGVHMRLLFSKTKNHVCETRLNGYLSLQQIYYGAPGTGKSHIINEITERESVIRTTFHPDSDYSTFVGAYKPTTKEITMRDLSGHPIVEGGKVLTEDKIVYEFVEQAFLQAYVQAWKYYAEAEADAEPKKQFLVIEEINRGNCAQIFGDLFQLLDRNNAGFSDYPVNADNDMRKQLAKAFKGLSVAQAASINSCYKGKDVVSKVISGEILLLPNNLYIWATMNTSDQSLFPIDSAFKRRWDWQYIPISKGMENGTELNWRIVADTKQYDWWSFLTKINDRIGSVPGLGEDKKLGFFFCKATNGIISAETFVGKVVFYLWNDVFRSVGYDDAMFQDADNSELSFSKFYATDANGKTIVRKDKVERFLTNLGVEEVVETEDAETEEYNATSVYAINGVKKNYLYEIVYQVVSDYVQAHQTMSAKEIREYFVTSCSGIGISHIVETEDEYHVRDGQKSQARSAKELVMPNDEKIYISTQWRAKLPTDNFMLFIETAKNNNWGVIAPAE